MEKIVSAYLVKLRRGSPFLATLSLYMNYTLTDRVEQFDTDGRNVRINPAYFEPLGQEQKMGVMLHATLHSALLHTVRRGVRIAEIWNIASDIVVNAIIADTSFPPPPDTAVEPRYAELSVEQVYAQLLASASRLGEGHCQTHPADGSRGKPGNAGGGNCNSEGNTLETAATQPTGAVAALQTLYPAVADLRESRDEEEPGSSAECKRLEGFWKRAMTRAQTVEQMSGKHQDDLPEGLVREIDQVLNPQIDWRVLLWRFMARTPCDFSGFDRRFVHQGLYLDQLEGESLKVHIAMDTSGSIEDHELAQFRAEVESIVRCYSHIDAKLYFVDADVYGPYPLSAEMSVSQAEGGGGTSFAVFFEHLEADFDPFEATVVIYLTDGFGDFPETPPSIPVLWVVTHDGADEYPFGEVAQLAY